MLNELLTKCWASTKNVYIKPWRVGMYQKLSQHLGLFTCILGCMLGLFAKFGQVAIRESK